MKPRRIRRRIASPRDACGGEGFEAAASVKPLLFEGEHLVRQIEKNGSIWFVGLDVCRVLGIKDHHQALERLDEDERGGYTVPTPMGDQSMIVVTKNGLRWADSPFLST